MTRVGRRKDDRENRSTITKKEYITKEIACLILNRCTVDR